MDRKKKSEKDIIPKDIKDKLKLGDLIKKEREGFNMPNAYFPHLDALSEMLLSHKLSPLMKALSQLEQKFNFLKFPYSNALFEMQESMSQKKIPLMKTISIAQTLQNDSLSPLASCAKQLVPNLPLIKDIIPSFKEILDINTPKLSDDDRTVFNPRYDLISPIYPKKAENIFQHLQQADWEFFLNKKNKLTLFQWACLSNGYKPLCKIPDKISVLAIYETYLLLQDAFSDGDFGIKYRNVSFESALIPINKLFSWSKKNNQIFSKEIESYCQIIEKKNKNGVNPPLKLTGNHHSIKRSKILKAALGAIFLRASEISSGKDVLKVINKENLCGEEKLAHSERVNTQLINKWMKILNENSLPTDGNESDIEKIFGVAVSIVYNFKDKISFNDVPGSTAYVASWIDNKRDKIGLLLSKDDIYTFINNALREAC